ncbi:MAG: hypothetical protein LBM64_02305 [Deltaproteobacteria bacterium]|jgi:hypothetical protein|nr:hypothetical protein [Deltaproteobacteria bacterium]
MAKLAPLGVAVILLLSAFIFQDGPAYAGMPVGELRQLQRQNDHILQQQEERLRLQEEELRRRGGPASSLSS